MEATKSEVAPLSSATLNKSETVTVPQKSVSRFSYAYRAIIGGALLLGAPALEKAEAGEPLSPANSSKGTLMLVGGGPLTDALKNRYFELAGGEDAEVALVTTADIDADNPDMPLHHYWSETRFRFVEVIHTRSREEANKPEFCARIKKKKGAWFCGGRQERLEEAYAGTLFQDTLQEFVREGGLVGGTSAGAAIMPIVIVRKQDEQGDPVTGKGFGLLGEAMLEQHFNRGKGRMDRFTKMLNRNPGRPGVALEESTAIEVGPSGVTVHGQSNAYYWAPASQYHPEDAIILKAGQNIPMPMDTNPMITADR